MYLAFRLAAEDTLSDIELQQDLDDDLLTSTRRQLSFLQKRRGEMPLALSLWILAPLVISEARSP